MQSMIYLRATRGARNPNLQVVITHASHLCSKHSFGLPLRKNGMHRTHLLTRVWTICQVKRTRSIAREQKRVDLRSLRSLSTAVPNLLLLIVQIIF